MPHVRAERLELRDVSDRQGPRSVRKRGVFRGPRGPTRQNSRIRHQFCVQLGCVRTGRRRALPFSWFGSLAVGLAGGFRCALDTRVYWIPGRFRRPFPSHLVGQPLIASPNRRVRRGEETVPHIEAQSADVPEVSSEGAHGDGRRGRVRHRSCNWYACLSVGIQAAFGAIASACRVPTSWLCWRYGCCVWRFQVLARTPRWFWPKYPNQHSWSRSLHRALPWLSPWIPLFLTVCTSPALRAW